MVDDEPGIIRNFPCSRIGRDLTAATSQSHELGGPVRDDPCNHLKWSGPSRFPRYSREETPAL